MKNIAIIPARAGSKGIKNKNIKLLNGKPLMAYTIEAALKSGVFDEVMVSTDSSDYRIIAKEAGASVPFLRSDKNASDTASSWDMVKEVLKGYEQMGKTFDMFCLLQPTSPLRDVEDIRNAYALFDSKAARAVVSVCELEHSIGICNTLPEDGCMGNFLSLADDTRRQEQKKYYRLNGAIYMVDINKFMQDTYIYQSDTYAYVMEQIKSVDIDTECDFLYAETCMRYIGCKDGDMHK
ncbi:MAG: acylneuraminate cytidylyltransferase family protein [Clostridium sp.]|nr:acylneuraminate cytidylyltransferase family protein [Clostridium sp.]MCM1207434.1 acylneuraminate cytidylyltransferase family protein [Ruminococcus sp.]